MGPLLVQHDGTPVHVSWSNRWGFDRSAWSLPILKPPTSSILRSTAEPRTTQPMLNSEEIP